MDRKALGLLLFIILYTCQIFCVPKKDLWVFWQAHDNNSKVVIDHAKWQLILSKGVIVKKSANLVNYPLLEAKYHIVLKEYLSYLSSIKITNYNKNEQLAYWINLYNALTVNLVLEHLPVKSIKYINLSGFLSGPWDHEIFQVSGHKISLNDIEHRIIRPIWNDPRIHYVLNCASIGCPDLSQHVYTGNNINKALIEAAKNFINDKRGVLLTLSKKLILSKIYSWYDVDFGNNEQVLIEHIKKYASNALKKELIGIKSISGYEYNWELNCFGCE